MSKRQRGNGVFGGSIRGLKKLNALGFGRDPALTLNLVYNPQGPSLPPPQASLEADYKRVLGEQYGIVFNKLFVLANMPIQRFGSMLVTKGEFDGYIDLLREAHLDANLDGVMCRNLISVDWRGYVYDCDFNQMLDLPLVHGSRKRAHLSDLLDADIDNNPIRTAGHCYGCTAGQGSSCGGALKEAAGVSAVEPLELMQPGRSCPTDYVYSPKVFARLPDFEAETIYVVGGLYGNLAALAAVEQLAAQEMAPVAIVFNGDFHWFDAESGLVCAIRARRRPTSRIARQRRNRDRTILAISARAAVAPIQRAYRAAWSRARTRF